MKHGFYHECDEAGVTMFGRFSRGEKAGPQWVSTRGGGWLVAEVDTEDRARGEATFLYPDLVTALTGTFVRGRMVAAVSAKVRIVFDSLLVQS